MVPVTTAKATLHTAFEYRAARFSYQFNPETTVLC